MVGGNGASPDRRRVLAAGGAFLAVGLAGCNDGSGPGDTGASAGKSGDRVFFKDSIGWVSQDAGRITLAFLPELVDPQVRDAVVANDGLYPALPFGGPVLEVRLTLGRADARPDGSAEPRLTADLIRGVMATYWNFEDPTPVLSFARAEDGKWDRPGLDLVNLDGLVRKGGWAVGTVRASMIYEGYDRRKEDYYLNAQFETSLA